MPPATGGRSLRATPRSASDKVGSTIPGFKLVLRQPQLAGPLQTGETPALPTFLGSLSGDCSYSKVTGNTSSFLMVEKEVQCSDHDRARDLSGTDVFSNMVNRNQGGLDFFGFIRM